MAVTSIEIRDRGPYAGGEPFGEAGPFEWVEGVLRFAVDPAHAANREIVDLDLAARDGDGLVEFESDFGLLMPADPTRGSGRLLLDVANRGNRLAHMLNRAIPPLEPVAQPPAGDGFLMRRGWSTLWVGWQWDVPRGRLPGFVGLQAPVALRDGRPIAGQVCVEVVVYVPTASVPLCDALGMLAFEPYRAADVEEAGAVLTVQDGPNSPRTEVPRARWRFAHDEGGEPVADDSAVWLEGGFEPGRIYDVVYTTRVSPVVGAGLLAVRDGVSFFRHGGAAEGNPLAGAVRAAHGFGISQSGRFLRTFLYHGLNVDESGRQVFDGVLPVVAGGRRGEFNHRYAQPSVEVTPGFGHLPPFADGRDVSGGLLARQRALGGVPKVFQLNSASEYWRGDASLIHIDPETGHDLELPDDTRVYAMASTQHGPGMLPLADTPPIAMVEGIRGAHLLNTLDTRPLFRAALVNLDRWASEGVEPSASCHPRIEDGTAVPREEALAALPAIPGARRADAAGLRSVPRGLDLGPDATRGVGRWPAGSEVTYPCFVSRVDADGNDVAGIRLPEVEHPAATYLPWNPRHAETGGEGELLRYLGSTLPLPGDAAARARSGDARPSLAERYGGREGYARLVEEHTERLIGDGYVLAEDRDHVVQAALRRYDATVAWAARQRALTAAT
jgi:hypothetical protein